jgi:hypothetical protein
MQENKMLPVLQKKCVDTNMGLKIMYVKNHVETKDGPKLDGYRFHPVKYNVGMMSLK